MEAATPLPFAQVRLLGERLLIDGLAVDDECAVRLAREHEDPAKLVLDAIEIGARVLDREQTGTEVTLLRKELEQASGDVTRSLAENADRVGEQLSSQVAELFGPESGMVSKVLQRHFSDDSHAAVQHRVKAAIEEVMTKSREELRRQFSTADGNNPLSIFQKTAVESINAASGQQHAHLRAMNERLEAMRLEIAQLRAEKETLAEVEAEREKGTSKGRTFEETVFEALDQIAAAQGDDCDAVGDLSGGTGKKGDVVVAIDACAGPARGRIVFEAKTSRLSKPKALEELDAALRERNADYAVLVVSSEEKVPAKMLPLREYNGDKMIVTYDPEDGSVLPLQVAYALARARIVMSRAGGEGLDSAAMHDALERALGAMDAARTVKSELSGATTKIDRAQAIVATMEARVREHLGEIAELVAAAAAEEE